MKILKNYFEKPNFLGVLLIIYLVNPFNFGFLVGYFIFIILIIKKEFLQKNIDFDFLLLTIFSLVYSAFYALDPDSGTQLMIIYAIFPQTFYLLGKYLCSKVKNEETLFRSLFFVGFMYSFSALISVLVSISEDGFGQINRSLPLIWAGRVVPATIMGSFFTLNMCIPALLVVRQIKLSFYFRVFMIVIYVLSLLCILRIGTRTQIVISLFTILTALIYIIPKQSLKKNIVIFSFFFIGVLLIIQNVNFDLSSDWLSAFAGRMENNGGKDIASGGGRTSRWVKSIENLFTNPLGWSVNEFGRSHNLWLDVLRVSGFIPFILIIIFSVRSFFKVKKITKLNKQMLSFFNQIRVYWIALFLLFMVEPIFEGMLSAFLVFCFIIGALTKFENIFKEAQVEKL